MKQSQELIFELLRISTGAQESLSHTYTDRDWKEAMDIAVDQTIIGVIVSALERIKEKDKTYLPDEIQMLQWIGMCFIVEENTRMMTESGGTVVKFFHNNGFACHLLKGSSLGRYYPQPDRRAAGDIDVWVVGGRKKIYDFARSFDKDGRLYGVNYHHIHFHLLEDVHVEVHIWPSYLSSPVRNRRLHKFCNLHLPTMDSVMPSLAFDRAFVLLHCYRHICGHGVGLRQIMDYFYVLKQGFTPEERDDAVYWIKRLGMGRFASGMMWVLQEMLGLEPQFLLMKPNAKEGSFIIDEVLKTGNMGCSDTRNWGSLKTPLSRFFFNLRRDIYLAGHYPHEALWQPVFSVWLYFWRLCKGLLKDREE